MPMILPPNYVSKNNITVMDKIRNLISEYVSSKDKDSEEIVNKIKNEKALIEFSKLEIRHKIEDINNNNEIKRKYIELGLMIDKDYFFEEIINYNISIITSNCGLDKDDDIVDYANKLYNKENIFKIIKNKINSLQIYTEQWQKHIKIGLLFKPNKYINEFIDDYKNNKDKSIFMITLAKFEKNYNDKVVNLLIKIYKNCYNKKLNNIVSQTIKREIKKHINNIIQQQKFIKLGMILMPNVFIQYFINDYKINKENSIFYSIMNNYNSQLDNKDYIVLAEFVNSCNDHRLINTFQQIIHNKMNIYNNDKEKKQNYLELGLRLIPKYFINDLIIYYYCIKDDKTLLYLTQKTTWNIECYNKVLQLIENSNHIPYIILDKLKRSYKNSEAAALLEKKKLVLKDEYLYYLNGSIYNTNTTNQNNNIEKYKKTNIDPINHTEDKRLITESLLDIENTISSKDSLERNCLNNNTDCLPSKDLKLFYILEKAGVAESECKPFASYLIAAYRHRIPILLAGPCGEQIANVFSISVCGAMPYIFDCKKDYNTTLVDDMLKSENEVVIIKHPFATNWRETILELLAESENFYILTNPFYEDLLIEPISLYNYVMPFITEIFIDKPPMVDIRSLKHTKIDLPVSTSSFKSLHSELIKDMKLSHFCLNQIQTLLNEMHNLLLQQFQTDNSRIVIQSKIVRNDNYENEVSQNINNEILKAEYKYVLFPYAYVTNHGDSIAPKWQKIDKGANFYLSKYFNIKYE